MTDNKTNWLHLVVVAVITGVLSVGLALYLNKGGPENIGIGTLPIENYVPAIKFNAGYYSALPIQTTSTFNATGLSSLSSIAVGTNGTTLSQVNGGTCYIRPLAATISASSTATVECQGTAGFDASGVSALTGVDNGDAVFIQLSTTTAGVTGMGLHVAGATASGTAGYIMVTVSNMTGNTFTWPTTGTASGTAQYWAIE